MNWASGKYRKTLSNIWMKFVAMRQLVNWDKAESIKVSLSSWVFNCTEIGGQLLSWYKMNGAMLIYTSWRSGPWSFGPEHMEDKKQTEAQKLVVTYAPAEIWGSLVFKGPNRHALPQILILKEWNKQVRESNLKDFSNFLCWKTLYVGLFNCECQA